MSLLNEITMAMRIALRDMRGGARSLWLLIGGAFIGVATVALVGTTSQSLIDGARSGALESIGGNLSLRLFHRPPSEAELITIRKEGDVSISTELRPMARAIINDSAAGASLLVELKGVDRQYPLYGAAKTRPAGNLYHILNQQGGIFGAVADAALFKAMGMEVGDIITIGEARYQLRGELIHEPGRTFRAFTIGPRIMVLNDSLLATGLIDEGAEIYYYTHVKLASGSDSQVEAAAAMARIDQAFPQSGWRMVNAQNGVPGVERSLSMAHVLMLFIGLGVMLVGGAGISGAVRAHVEEKMVIIAILKSIGLPSRLITLAIGFEIMVAVLIGSASGVLLGAFGPTLAAYTLSNHLPFALEVTPSFKQLLAAGLFGILVAALFTWWPLMRVLDMNAQVLLRERITPSQVKQGVKGWLGVGIILTALIALIFWISPMPVLTLGFMIGALVLATFYYALGLGLSRFAKILAKGKSVNLRHGLSNLYRAGAPTGPIVMALGLTLTLLVALDGIGSAVSHHVRENLPYSAPDLVAFSINPEMSEQLGTGLVSSGVIERQRILPFLHARVQAINGVAVSDLEIPKSLNWFIRGDRGVSFAAKLPDGMLWDDPQSNRAGFSVDAGVSKKLGLSLGDTITLNIGGQVRSGLILNFHNVDWTRLDLDFPIIASPATFKGIPYTLAASLKAKPGEAAALEAFIKSDFPNMPLIRVADVLRSLGIALNAIVTGLETAALMCGIAALVVLAGSTLQGLRERIDESVLFKVLGASRSQLLGQLTVEFLGLGFLVALAAVPLGYSVAYGVAYAAGLGIVSVSWISGIAIAGVTIFVTLVVGLMVTLSAYTAVPARILRARKL